jgi:hypothetical protein
MFRERAIAAAIRTDVVRIAAVMFPAGEELPDVRLPEPDIEIEFHRWVEPVIIEIAGADAVLFARLIEYSPLLVERLQVASSIKTAKEFRRDAARALTSEENKAALGQANAVGKARDEVNRLNELAHRREARFAELDSAARAHTEEYWRDLNAFVRGPFLTFHCRARKVYRRSAGRDELLPLSTIREVSARCRPTGFRRSIADRGKIERLAPIRELLERRLAAHKPPDGVPRLKQFCSATC